MCVCITIHHRRRALTHTAAVTMVNSLATVKLLRPLGQILQIMNGTKRVIFSGKSCDNMTLLLRDCLVPTLALHQ